MKGIDGRSGFRASRARRAWLAVMTAMMLAFSLLATGAPAGAGDVVDSKKVTICHAAGREGTTHYETLNISENAVYGRNGEAGHFEENGTPRAGHEQDYFGECIEGTDLNSASLTIVKQVRSSANAPQSRFPFRIATDDETDSFALAGGGTKTFVFEFETDRFDVSVGEITDELDDGFAFVSASCSGGDPASSDPVIGESSTIVNLLDGADVTCTFVNTYEPPQDLPSVKVVKEVRGDDGAKTTEFRIVVGTPVRNAPMTFEDGGSHTFLPVAGTKDFGIEEQAIDEAGWTTSISCVSDEEGAFGSQGRSLVIGEIGEGEDIVCTVINTFDAGEGPGPSPTENPGPTEVQQPCFDNTAENELGECVPPEPPAEEIVVLGVQIESTTTTVDAVTTDSLPFTGDAASPLVTAGLLVLFAGALMLAGSFLDPSLTRTGRHESPTGSFRRWNSS